MTYHLSTYFQQMTQRQPLLLKQSRQNLCYKNFTSLTNRIPQNLFLNNFELMG